jgi:hypothetical protein
VRADFWLRLRGGANLLATCSMDLSSQQPRRRVAKLPVALALLATGNARGYLETSAGRIAGHQRYIDVGRACEKPRPDENIRHHGNRPRLSESAHQISTTSPGPTPEG